MVVVKLQMLHLNSQWYESHGLRDYIFNDYLLVLTIINNYKMIYDVQTEIFVGGKQKKLYTVLPNIWISLQKVYNKIICFKITRKE